MDTKDTNPKDAVGVRKWRQFCTVPMTVMAEVGVAMLEGARKYGRHNYRVAGVRASVYIDAAMGHCAQWWEGEDIDADSSLSHITKAIASLVVVRDAMIQDMLVDDRPPKAKLDEARTNLQAAVDSIFERYPDAKEAFTHMSDFPVPEFHRTTAVAETEMEMQQEATANMSHEEFIGMMKSYLDESPSEAKPAIATALKTLGYRKVMEVPQKEIGDFVKEVQKQAQIVSTLPVEKSETGVSLPGGLPDLDLGVDEPVQGYDSSVYDDFLSALQSGDWVTDQMMKTKDLVAAVKSANRVHGEPAALKDNEARKLHFNLVIATLGHLPGWTDVAAEKVRESWTSWLRAGL